MENNDTMYCSYITHHTNRSVTTNVSWLWVNSHRARVDVDSMVDPLWVDPKLRKEAYFKIFSALNSIVHH